MPVRSIGNGKGRLLMRKFTVVAAVALAAALSSVAAKAEYNYGPVKEGKMCWKTSQSSSAGVDFGYWATCPAAATVARKHRRS
jgi:hypothetical protein